MSTMSERPVLRLSTPQDVLDAVPYLLGFHPQNSLVLIGVKGEHNRVGLTMRCDLIAYSLSSTLDRLGDALRRDGCDQVIGVVYGPDALLGELWADTIRLQMPAFGIKVRELIRVADGRWWSYLCDEPACCPPDGTEIGSSSDRVVATAVAAGMVAETSREALVARLDPPSEGARTQARFRFTLMGGEPDDADLALIRALVSRFTIERTPHATPRELARVAYAMGDFHLRDEVLTWALDSDRVHGLQALLLEVVRHLGGRESVPAATVLAAVYYLGGQGAMARVLLDHVTQHDSEYSLALLLGKMLDEGLHPDQLQRSLMRTRNQLHPDGI